MSTKKAPGVGSLFREAGRKARLEAEKVLIPEHQFTLSGGPEVIVKPPAPRIFNILDYIESPWGLNMHPSHNTGARLFPVQRFIIKMYYNMPLDDKERTIEISDMLNTRVEHRFTEKEYLQYLYSEGRCNIGEQDHDRRLLILPCGRRAGKCVKPNTLTYTNRGIVPIGSLGDLLGPEYQPLTVTVAQEGKRQAQSAYFYNGGVKPTIRIRSRNGFELEGTPNHRVKALSKKGVIVWRRLDEVQQGDFLGIHRKIDLWAEKEVDLTSIPIEAKGANAKPFSPPPLFNSKWGELLGVLVGDGSWTQPSSFEVTVGPYPEWLEHVKKLFVDTFGSFTEQLEKGRSTTRVRYHSSLARTFFDRLGYSLSATSDDKRIPWVVLQSPKPVVAAFLRGLFETDGSIERGRIVSFSTASHKLAQDLQTVLLNFGIVVRIKARLNTRFNKTYYHLTLLGAESIRIFASEIGFLSERKNAPLREHIAKGDQGNKSATESIPFQYDWACRLLESSPKYASEDRKLRRRDLRTKLGNTIKASSGEDMTYPRLRECLEAAIEAGADSACIEHFQSLLDACYFYDDVVEVSQHEAHVCDLNVPDGESFVANGFTNHNTTLSGIFASYEMYRLLNLHHPQGYYGLPPGNRIQIISVATDKDQAGLLFKEVSSHIARCDYFTPYIASSTQSDYLFRTAYDIEKFGVVQRYDNGKFQSLNGKASLRITFKSCVAKGLRGAGNIMVILDEMAHFIDAGQSSANDIWNAVEPSTAAFSPKNPENPTKPVGPVESRIICISSPLNKQGKFYELFQQAYSGGEASHNLLAIQAPTWEINPTVPAEYYKGKYAAGPRVFMTEHGAQFSDRVRGWIEREVDLLNCIDPNLRPVEVGIPRVAHQMGIDVGLIGDGTSFVITYCDDGKIVLAYHELWQAGTDWRKSNPHLPTYSCQYARTIGDVERLDFGEISEHVIQLTKRFYVTDGLFDRWNGLPLEENLHKRGLTMFKSIYFTRDQTSKMYQTVKEKMLDGKLRLYNYPLPRDTGDGGAGSEKKHSPLITELLSLQAEQMSKNVVIVEAPKQPGMHDDLSDGLVRAVFLSQERIVNTKITHSGGRVGMPAPMSVGQYQTMRARSHAGFTERTIPRSIGLRLGRRR